MTVTTPTNMSRIVVVGPPRTGTTFLASLLAQLGIDFGLESRSWDVNSGYYEHPDLIRVYGEIRKYNRLSQLSDRLAAPYQASAIRSLAKLLKGVQAIKFPPISAQLPFLIDRAGYTPVLAISARRFEPYAISRMRMEGVCFNTCKQDYLKIYRTALLLLRIYKGAVVDYEALINNRHNLAEITLSSLTGAGLDLVRQVIESSVKQARSHGQPEDEECQALYERLVSTH